jgi:hypothetical protein
MSYNDPEPYKDAARMAVRNALRRGELVRPAHCENCLIPCKPQAHHNDHELPLKVDWLCIDCHVDVHRKFDGQYLRFNFEDAVIASQKLLKLK